MSHGSALRPDSVERRARGLIAIAISDYVSEQGIKPTTWPVTTALSFFRVFTKFESTSLRGARNRGMLWVILAVVAAFVLPLMIPIELIRSRRVDRHNRTKLGELRPASADLRTVFDSGLQLFVIDWRAWHDGAPRFSGTALAVAEGDGGAAAYRVVWLIAARGGTVPNGVDAASVQRSQPDRRFTHGRFEWEAEDPFEATERDTGAA